MFSFFFLPYMQKGSSPTGIIVDASRWAACCSRPAASTAISPVQFKLLLFIILSAHQLQELSPGVLAWCCIHLLQTWGKPWLVGQIWPTGLCDVAHQTMVQIMMSASCITFWSTTQSLPSFAILNITIHHLSDPRSMNTTQNNTKITSDIQ